MQRNVMYYCLGNVLEMLCLHCIQSVYICVSISMHVFVRVCICRGYGTRPKAHGMKWRMFMPFSSRCNSKKT